jgi:D-alanyl-lipoteichoic acid acyltransferase DltB (MBOAT superfamily)
MMPPAFARDLSWEKFLELFRYDAANPLLFSSGFFLFLFIGFLVVYRALRERTLARIIYVTLFSLYFYYKSSGVWFLLLVFTATSDFLIARRVARAPSHRASGWWVALSLCVNLGMLAYFKYFNFLLDLLARLGHELGNLFGNAALQGLGHEHADIFLPVGISFFTFQSLSYIIDVHRGRVQPTRRWIDYLFYVSFFPPLVAGPIIRAREFLPQMYRRPVVSRGDFGEGFFLILCGVFKKVVISDYISLNFVDRVFDAPLLYTGVENLLGVYGYALQIYCDFSGYSDMAIGIALLLGFRVNVNFDSPYQSASITEFWRRWHISLSSWLKDYLYISLGGNRKGRARTYLNLFITMLLGGLWHGASARFILWGAWHGAGLAVHKFIMGRFRGGKPTGGEMSLPRRIAGILVTFHFVCFGWIFFRASSMQAAGEMLSQIFTDFRPEIFPQFIAGYAGVCCLLLLGYLLHFAPRRAGTTLQGLITRSPLLVQALVFILVMFLVIQMKSSTVQPFIYFQF